MDATLKAIIVDDDESGRENLQNLISQYCRRIIVRGHASSVVEAKTLLREHSVDVVFLDINMPKEDGFALLDCLSAEARRPLIVFVTAYDQYSIKAIRHGAFDYLLKPIDIDELQTCEQRLIDSISRSTHPQLQSDVAASRVIITHAGGTRVIEFHDVIYLKADKNYTVFYLRKGSGIEKFVVSKTLADVESILHGAMFFRVHKSYLVNAIYIKEHRNIDGGYIIMSNNDKVEVSRRRSASFRQFLHDYYTKHSKS